MKCSRCQQENPPQAKFCLECATPLALRCTNCGTQLPAGAKFCFECATPVSAPGSPPRHVSPEAYTPKHLAERIINSKAALEGERKLVTVLFADLKGSMELLADRDPEEARKLLDPVLDRMMEAVHRYEGTVNQVMGDGIMALFGAPLAHEDHAVRACYAALRMQEAVKRYAEGVHRSAGVPLHIRVGVNSGEVVVRSIGSDLHMDYTAVGQTTHLAARLEQMAMPGSILVSPDTLELAEGFVVAKALGERPVKGLEGPIEVFEVVGAGTARSRLHAAAARGLTRFVGRDSEMDQLLQALELAGAGCGQVVGVVGDAGVGKSRLFWEFTHSHRVEGWLLVESSSVSYGKATAFLPLIDLLRAYFQIEARDDPRKIHEKVTGKLLSLDRALEPSLPALLWLLDVPVGDAQWQRLDPPQRRQQALDGIKRLLLRESRVQPLLLVFEDLHWIDSETQAFLDSVVESLPTARLLFLVNYRPEYQHAWGSKTYYRQLRIDPLPPESAEELLAALLGSGPDLQPLRRLLIERTEGNPFFLEESIRTLVETKVLTGERGAYRLAKASHTLQIPATAQAILAARIDRLAPEDKRLLRSASVLGKDVPFTLLRAIAEGSEESLRRGLANLQAAEFLYEVSLFPDLEYTFKHALTHEVAYGGLLHDRRRQLHAAVVGAIEQYYGQRLGEQTERLAHHAVRAEAWDKAVRYLWQAGRNARARSAYRQAVVFLEQALEILRRSPETGENAAVRIDLLCRDLSDPLNILTQYELLLRHLHDAELLAERVGDRARRAEVLARSVSPLRFTGQHDRALETGQKALALAQEVGDAQLTILARLELAVAHSIGGDARRAEPLLRETMSSLDALPATAHGPHTAWLRRRSLMGLVRALTVTGRFPEAVQRGEEALRLAQDLGHPAPLAGALYRLGFAHCCRGDVDRAIEFCARSLALSLEREVHDALQWASAYLGAAYLLAGDTRAAVSHLESAVAAGESSRSLDPFMLVSLGEAYLHAGRGEEAVACAVRARDACRKHNQRGYEAQVLRLLGEIASERDLTSLAEAETHYLDALAIADDLGMCPLVAHCHLGLGKLYTRTGKREQAQEHLVTATTLYREMGMTYWLEKAEAEVRG
jgi:predicted ATPase/class 3 adenylate cyclase